MVDLCYSGSVVCIITSNTCIMDARCCIGVYYRCAIPPGRSRHYETHDHECWIPHPQMVDLCNYGAVSLIKSAGSHIHEMVDLCNSGSVVCIITSNTCIMDARCCIGVVQYIGAHAVPRYTQWHTNDTSNTSALMGADRDVGYHMSRTMDQGSRGSGVSCPETVSRIAHIVSTLRMACRAHAALLTPMHVQWHYMCHARCKVWATSPTPSSSGMMVTGMVTRMTTSQPCHVSPCMTTSVHP